MLGSDVILLGLQPLDALPTGAKSGVPRIGPVDFKDVPPGDFRLGIVIRGDAGDVHPVFVSLDFFHKRVNAHVIVVAQGSAVRVDEHLAKPGSHGIPANLVAELINQSIANKRTVEIVGSI